MPRDTGSFCPQGHRSGTGLETAVCTSGAAYSRSSLFSSLFTPEAGTLLGAFRLHTDSFLLLFSGPGFQNVTPWPGLEALSRSEPPGWPGRAVHRLPCLGPQPGFLWPPNPSAYLEAGSFVRPVKD